MTYTTEPGTGNCVPESQPAWQAQKGEGEGEGEGEKHETPSYPPPFFPFSYPLPLSTPATQANRVYHLLRSVPFTEKRPRMPEIETSIKDGF